MTYDGSNIGSSLKVIWDRSVFFLGLQSARSASLSLWYVAPFCVSSLSLLALWILLLLFLHLELLLRKPFPWREETLLHQELQDCDPCCKSFCMLICHYIIHFHGVKRFFYIKSCRIEIYVVPKLIVWRNLEDGFLRISAISTFINTDCFYFLIVSYNMQNLRRFNCAFSHFEPKTWFFWTAKAKGSDAMQNICGAISIIIWPMLKVFVLDFTTYFVSKCRYFGNRSDPFSKSTISSSDE